MNSEFIVAVHAMVVLHHKGTTLSSEDLSDNICTNPVRVRRVMAKLGKAGLVETKRGCADGGYCYRKAARVTLLDIADALEVKFVETAWRSGDEHKDCPIASGMSGYMDELFGELDEICRARLEKTTIAEIEQKLFSAENRKEEK